MAACGVTAVDTPNQTPNPRPRSLRHRHSLRLVRRRACFTHPCLPVACATQLTETQKALETATRERDEARVELRISEAKATTSLQAQVSAETVVAPLQRELQEAKSMLAETERQLTEAQEQVRLLFTCAIAAAALDSPQWPITRSWMVAHHTGAPAADTMTGSGTEQAGCGCGGVAA